MKKKKSLSIHLAVTGDFENRSKVDSLPGNTPKVNKNRSGPGTLDARGVDIWALWVLKEARL